MENIARFRSPEVKTNDFLVRWLQKELFGLEEDFGVVAGGVVDDAEKVGFVDGFRIWAVAKIRFDSAFQFFHFVDGIYLR